MPSCSGFPASHLILDEIARYWQWLNPEHTQGGLCAKCLGRRQLAARASRRKPSLF